MQTPQDVKRKIELRVQTLRILWFALATSIVINLGCTVFLWKPGNQKPNNMLSLVFVAAGMLMTVVSIFVKQKFLSRAVEQQSAVVLQQGYVATWALCEVSAFLGLLDFFLTGNRFYYVLFVIALMGDLINFPKRQDVEAVFPPTL